TGKNNLYTAATSGGDNIVRVGVNQRMNLQVSATQGDERQVENAPAILGVQPTVRFEGLHNLGPQREARVGKGSGLKVGGVGRGRDLASRAARMVEAIYHRVFTGFEHVYTESGIQRGFRK
ncbi:MAG: hypothetical protein KAJ17_14455, partial [Candidatus Krumholzibacteria bacterium]|nr:hypothetical protein [Candidatus Krumholzibacteria bacterium]